MNSLNEKVSSDSQHKSLIDKINHSEETNVSIDEKVTQLLG